jgi:hypothetical protein
MPPHRLSTTRARTRLRGNFLSISSKPISGPRGSAEGLKDYFRIADHTEVDGQALYALRKPQCLGRMAEPRLRSVHRYQAS